MFKVGDKVEALSSADDHYEITVKGWVGKIAEVNSNCDDDCDQYCDDCERYGCGCLCDEYEISVGDGGDNHWVQAKHFKLIISGDNKP